MGFTTPSAGGITKLSQLLIDADKNWAAYGIENIKEVAAGMAMGDVPFFNGAVIAILTPGPIGTVLTTQGVGADPNFTNPP